MVKINLGCGPSGIKGWINYDWGLLPIVNKYPFLIKLIVKLGWIPKSYLTRWPNFQLVDIRKKLNWRNNSVDYVYCSQVLEHFDKWQAIDIAMEVYRILKTDGIFRVSVPDADKLINKYLTSKNCDRLAREIWGFEKDIRPRSLINKISRWFIRGHQWLYNLESLKNVLKESGFKQINVVNYRQGKTPDLEKLDISDHQELSMYVEAIK